MGIGRGWRVSEYDKWTAPDKRPSLLNDGWSTVRSLIISYFAIRTIIHPRYLQPVTDKSSVIISESQHVCARPASRTIGGEPRGGALASRRVVNSTPSSRQDIASDPAKSPPPFYGISNSFRRRLRLSFISLSSLATVSSICTFFYYLFIIGFSYHLFYLHFPLGCSLQERMSIVSFNFDKVQTADFWKMISFSFANCIATDYSFKSIILIESAEYRIHRNQPTRMWISNWFRRLCLLVLL